MGRRKNWLFIVGSLQIGQQTTKAKSPCTTHDGRGKMQLQKKHTLSHSLLKNRQKTTILIGVVCEKNCPQPRGHSSSLSLLLLRARWWLLHLQRKERRGAALSIPPFRNNQMHLSSQGRGCDWRNEWGGGGGGLAAAAAAVLQW